MDGIGGGLPGLPPAGVPSGPAQVCTCEVGSARSRAGARQGTTYPSGGGALTVPRGCGAPGALRHRRLVPLGPAQVGTCHVVSARSRAGDQAFSRKPGRKSRGGMPPAPPFLWPARSHSLVLAWWGAAGDGGAISEAHVRALIWIRILREQGFGGESISLRGCTTYEGFPLGEAVTEGDG